MIDDVHRLVVVVSAQCRNMKELSFLPGKDWSPGDPLEDGQALPSRIYEQLTDPNGGFCRPVPGLDDIRRRL